MVRFKLYPNRSYEVIQGFLDELQTPGCYKITFEDGFYYIGMSSNIAWRMETHLIDSSDGRAYDLNEVSDRMIRVVLSKDKPVKNFRKCFRIELAFRMSETVLFEKIDDNVFNEKHHIHQNSGVMCLNVIDNIFWKGRSMKDNITMREIYQASEDDLKSIFRIFHTEEFIAREVRIIKRQLECYDWGANPQETFVNWLEDNRPELSSTEKEIIVDSFFDSF
jgi:hypothetical protein